MWSVERRESRRERSRVPYDDLPVHNGSFMRMMMLLDIVSSGIDYLRSSIA